MGVYDNFFELGGHSILATRLVSRIGQSLHIQISLKDIFNNAVLNDFVKLIIKSKPEEIYTLIQKAPLQENYDVSHAQKRMWILNKLDENKANYNIPHAIQFIGEVEVTIFNKAIQLLINKYEILRTIFINRDSHPKQKILTSYEYSINFVDLSKEENALQKAKKIAKKQASIIFGLEQKPPFEITLLKLENKKFVLLFTLHHIISDGWSTQILLKEITKNYEALKQNKLIGNSLLAIQYKDYTYWHNKLLNNQKATPLKKYWNTKFSGEITVLELPLDYSRSSQEISVGKVKEKLLCNALHRQLKNYAKDNNTTLFTVLITIVKTLLYRYTGQNDIIIGTPVSGRDHIQLEDQIGLYVNTLAIRSNIKGDASFDITLLEVKNNLLDAYEHQLYPFNKLVEDLNIEPLENRNPIFDVMVTMEETQNLEENLEKGSFEIAEFEQNHTSDKFDLLFSFSEENEVLTLRVDYKSNLFKNEKIEQLLLHFEQLATSCISNPTKKIQNYNYLNKNQQAQLDSFKGTSIISKEWKSVVDEFINKVNTNPHAIALVDEITSYTYLELHEKTNKIANLLLENYQIKENEIVAILCDRTAAYICNMLGVLKAGGAYLPLEKTFAQEYIDGLLKQTKTRVVLVDHEIKKTNTKTIDFLQITDVLLKNYKSDLLNNQITLNSLAYVMFTSGTTGIPKGVMVSHLNIIRLVKDTNYIQLSQKDKILQTGSLSFDAATFEIWGALLNGGQIHILKLEKLLDVTDLEKTIVKKGITKMWFTSSWFNQLVDIKASLFESLEQVLVGGERLSPRHIEKVKKTNPKLIITNGYGPTENTTFSICGEISLEDLNNIPLGYPINNTTVYILDKKQLPVPVGVTGEIYLGGLGLGLGYLNDKEKTAENFIKPSFIKEPLLYKTGDLGRWMNDGRITFHGRLDNQLKIRGYRIELSGILTVVHKHPSINDVDILALKVNNNSDRDIVMYYTTVNNVSKDELKEHLENELPSYMVPSYFIELEKFPLNKNGKVDRKKFPKPEVKENCNNNYTLPTSLTEIKIVEFVAEILNLKGNEISITANFFELRIHSLKVIALVAKIKEELKIDIAYGKMFSLGSIKELANYIENKEESSDVIIKKAAKKALYPVSSAQKRMYTLYKMNPNSIAYNVQDTIVFSNKYSKTEIERACNLVINRHESLRTNFVMKDGEIFQKINKQTSIALKIFHEDELEKALLKFVKPFNLNNELLIRIGYLEAKKTLLLDIHHSITDGASQEIIYEELLNLLSGKELTPVSFQFKDYTEWLYLPKQQDKLKQQKLYWKSRFNDEVPDLKLPLDFERTIHQNNEGKTIQFKLELKDVTFLKELSIKQKTTIYTSVLSVWSILLSKLGAVEDVVIGTPVLGRAHQQIMNTVGMFVNTVPVRLQPKGNETFISYLKQVKQNTLNDFENQEYPLEDILDTINYITDVSRNLLFDTMFSSVNDEKSIFDTSNITTKGVMSEKQSAVKFDMNLKIADLGNEIVCNLDYKTSLFNEITAYKIVERFQQFLTIFRDNSNIQLNHVSALLVSEEEEIKEKVNGTSVVFEQRNKTIDQLFSENAIKHRNRLGLADVNKRLTLAEVEEKVTQLASHIFEKVGSNNLIAIYMEPSVDVIISILAIFKSGSAYVPIDTELPSERIEHVLQDSGAKCLITTKIYHENINFKDVWIDIENEASWSFENRLEQSLNSPSKLAYIIYTSGSTGKPKGVRITQYQLCNYVQWFTKELNYSHTDSSVLLSSFAFDLGHSAVFPTIANGGALHMLKKEEYLDIDYLNLYLNKEKITFIKGTPTLFSLIINDPFFNPNSLEYLRYLMLGGEAIIYKDLTTYFNYYPNKKIINHYGPTEATIGCIIKHLSKENYHEIKGASVIGSPISNMNVYILDKYLKPVAPGVLGQLYLSGVAISEGYHNKQDLTKEQFIKNPFTQDKTMYATGDLACWTSSYEVEFKGRIDNQLKIRGYRVELEEISKTINTINFVQKSSILVKEENEQKLLIAFLETKEPGKIDRVRGLLEKLLPSYMIPNLIFPIDKMPTTANGKTDKKALAKLIDNSIRKVEEAKTNTEKIVLKLWNEILNIELNDINVNFFSLGGHSLRALKLIGKIEQLFHKKITLKEFFSNPTIKEIAKKIDKTKEVFYNNINPVKEKEYYPLSHSQRRLWMLHEFSEVKAAYNVPRAYFLKGNFSNKAINKAFTCIFNKHEILRTTFNEVKGEPKQFITPINEFKKPITFEDLKIEEAAIKKFIDNLSNLPFNLSEGPLISVKVYKKNETEHILFLNLHHIISDGWSATILLNELCEYYNAIVAKEDFKILELPIQYKDYSVWQKEQFENESFQKHKAFWANKLSGELTRFSLPLSYPKTKTNVNEGKSLRYVIDKDLINKLALKTTELGVSFYMLLLAAFKTLAYRYTLQNDILIGTIVAGREKEELADQLGFYVNTIAQRTFVNGKVSFAELLQTLKEDLLESVEHQYYPFDQVVNDLGITKEADSSSLFDIMFVHQNNEELDESVLLSGLEVTGLEGDLIESKFDASFVTREVPEGLQISVEYNAALYSEDFLQQFLKHYEAILNCIENNIETPIDELNYLEEDKKILLKSFNSTYKAKDYGTIHEIVEQKAIEQATKVAIVTVNTTVTYKELNQKANALANLIEEKYKPKSDTIIAFSIERSEWQIIAMLAILKVGAAFLPIDSKQPENRKNLILKDAKPILVICDNTLTVQTNTLNIEKLDVIKESLTKYPITNLDKIIHPNNLAYVIYTSGSTGKPKGTLIEHRGNINMVTDQIEQLKITKESKCLQFASISFDASIYEIFIGLYSGSTLVLTTDEIIANPLHFVDYITQKGVSFATLPPAYLSNLDKTKLTSLKTIVTAGESPNNIDAAYFSSKINYFNAYGPTEYSVCATLYKVKGNEKIIPIGKPLENTQVYILDTNMNPMPIGCWGEIHLAGDGISRGYINRPEKNKEVFLENPFTSTSQLYKTGDIGRWLEDGNIEFASRSGDMIKIRGYRVEKGEIVSTLLKNVNIKEVAVTFNEKQQNLTAYVVNRNSTTSEEIKRYLAEQLPTYMIPAFIIELNQIPLTTNGKIDYKELEVISEAMKETFVGVEFKVPENKTEEELLKLWKEVLGINVISTKDNFFEIGGQSITAMKLIGKVWKLFEKEIKLKDFLLNPTIKELANFLENTDDKKHSLVVSLNEVEEQEASLFMIPPVIGSSMIYRSLAQGFSIAKIISYGVQYRGFDLDEKLDTSIEDMAKNMVKEITPYLENDKNNIVLGYSMGALIAVEMVSIIEEMGYKTKLILIDKDPKNSFSDIFYDSENLKDKNHIHQIVNDHLKEFELPEFSKSRVSKLIRNNINLLINYEGFEGKIESEVLALEAKENRNKNRMLAWQNITNGRLSHFILKGNHYSILNNENQIFQVILGFINQKNQIL
ncbi:non-ribosomal peptide synthetase [Tenacibaculum ovolyticum]|uniref:non-ribosomal peptide synthetase n=1 Tax=Tenacibaculum ovolyticum TaxID=104270 RepID=UPI00293F2BA3|nr:non-ribosomal peptide synthetase [Tenacibaculum ovolyticum]